MFNESYKLKSKNEVLFWNFFISSFGLYFGYHHAIFNTLSDKFLDHVYGINNVNELNIISGNIFFYYSIGALIGSFIPGLIMNNFGRKKGVFLFLIASPLSTLLLLIQNIYIVYLARFFIGIMAGIMLSIPGSLIDEFMPSYYKRIGSNIFYLNITLGILLANLVGLIWGNNVGKFWYISLYWFLVFDLIKIILFFILFKFESPFYLFINNKKLELERFFRYYYKDEFYEESFNRYNEDMLLLIKGTKPSYRQIFFGKYAKIFWFLSILNVIQQISGINTIIFFSNKIFEEATNNKTLYTFLVALFNFIASFVPSIIQKFSLRKFLILGFSCCLLFWTLIIIGSFFKINELLVFSIILFVFSFSFSFGGSFFGYLSYIGDSRSVQMSIGFQWIIIIFLSKYSRVLIDLIGIGYLFLFYDIWLFFGFIFFLGYSIEVENKLKNQIFYEFNSKKFFKKVIISNNKILPTQSEINYVVENKEY